MVLMILDKLISQLDIDLQFFERNTSRLWAVETANHLKK